MRAEVEHLGNVTISVEDWDIANSYPARCITTDYTNWTTYISRKEVPANTPITDAEYWKPIARLDQEILADYELFKQQILYDISEYEQMLKEDYDAFKESYEQEWNSFKESCLSDINETKQSLIREINSALSNLTNQINTLREETIADINNTKQSLTNQFNQLSEENETFRDNLSQDYNTSKQEFISANNLFKAGIENRMDEVEQEMTSFLETSAEGGVALSKHFGNSNLIGITQKSLTDAVNQILSKISEMTGDYVTGVGIDIVPEVIDSSNQVNVNINGASEYINFDSIKVFINEEEIVSEEDVATFTEHIVINETSVVKVVATVLGVPYEKEKTIYVYYPYFIGCGNIYTDIVSQEYSRRYNDSPQGSFNVHCEEGQRVFIVIASEAASQIEQIEMNDFNIPMDVSTVEGYTVYTSKNTYVEGDYVIDVNY